MGAFISVIWARHVFHPIVEECSNGFFDLSWVVNDAGWVFRVWVDADVIQINGVDGAGKR
jgi:hypothetical protein